MYVFGMVDERDFILFFERESLDPSSPSDAWSTGISFGRNFEDRPEVLCFWGNCLLGGALDGFEAFPASTWREPKMLAGSSLESLKGRVESEYRKMERARKRAERRPKSVELLDPEDEQ